MTPIKMSGLPSMKRQHIQAEFSGLKQACPEGVYVSLTPGDAMLWSGVIFVRRGPYATAILRFQISFSDTYPDLPPLITFSSDLFHPLITPLTTHVYSTDSHNSGTVSANDEERLPPGGFSLRHGFPHWFGRATRSWQASRHEARSLDQHSTPPQPSSQQQLTPVSGRSARPASLTALTPFESTQHKQTSTYEVLTYLRLAFDDADLLDRVPLEAAGNPGAWQAWRTYRGLSTTGDGWNWDGVWEERSKRGVTASLSEAVLYGGAGPVDEVINFVHMEEGEVEEVKANLLRTLGVAA